MSQRWRARTGRMDGRALAALAVVLVAGVLAGCGDGRGWTGDTESQDFEPVRAGVLTVAAQLPSPGFWDGDTPSTVEGGFEAELAEALADRLDLSAVRVVPVAFDDLVAGDLDGYDLGLAQVSITRERNDVVDFSRPYLTTTVGVVGRPGTEADDLAAARRLRWGVVRSTTEQDLVEDRIRPDDDVRAYRDVRRALAGVVAGHVDVVALDMARALAEVSADDHVVLVAQIVAPQYFGAVLPDGSPNRDAVDSALRALARDGTLERLRDELIDNFDVATDDLPTIRVPM